MVFGGGHDPLTLKFRCGKCLPDIKVTLVDVDLDRARDAVVYEPFFYQGKRATWLPKRLRYARTHRGNRGEDCVFCPF